MRRKLPCPNCKNELLSQYKVCPSCGEYVTTKYALDDENLRKNYRPIKLPVKSPRTAAR
jgi:predicted amidophosphoribosyltransferase